MTKVKICGLMESQHVKTAVDAGVDAIGFVFAPSRRQVTIAKAQELAKNIPPGVLKIGVFVDASQDDIEQTFREVPLDFVQFHGDESSDFIEKVGLPSIKVLSVYSDEDAKRFAHYETDYFLFDTPGTDFKGGSGKTFDWQLMKDAGVQSDKVILAGGLNADNVAQAIRTVQPYMVDVSSGVEVMRRKDDKLIRAFIKAVKDEER
ncbi:MULTISPECIES: phosphoribosylanthranilate isomerase [Sporosarcina]|jgi:phosphoribosylanthranilate isomerase|uniref:N-(5'-phosphoribosyl)anthranilate isomerase n=1 Tax=Sporosarcina psychrophila TaxID=1476 RepID=A0ABV2KAH3_SPOPS|nr:phosphoribosylanthranilate isomerase [Sporosarcina sp. resist]QNK88274.1 phosphoribosylanthranilate isomerase [Sporosarcina sp. resist]